MLIVLNGYPGVGKLTIAQELAALVGGRLLDNHSVYNVAFALNEFKSPTFYETVRRIQAVADELIADLPGNVPIILTEALTVGSDWAEECWQRILRLAETRGPLYVVHVICDLDEHKRRIQSKGRAQKRKPRDPDMAHRNHDKAKSLMGGDSRRCLRLNATRFTEQEAANTVLAWLNQDRMQ